MPIGSIIGGLLKKKVKVPEFVPVDAQAEQKKAIAGNADAFEGASKLGGMVNEYNQAQLLEQFGNLTPGLDATLAGNASNISDMVGGVIPEDVRAQLFRKGAARSGEGGYGGSPRGDNLTSRDLGLTSLQVKTQGMNLLNNWLGTAKQTLVPDQFNVTSMFISPQQQTAFSMSERDSKFQRDFGSNQLKAAQAPQTIIGNAMIDFDNMLMQTASGVAGSAAGAAGGI